MDVWFAERLLEPIVCVQNVESRISNLESRISNLGIAEEQARGDVFEVDERACPVRVLEFTLPASFLQSITNLGNLNGRMDGWTDGRMDGWMDGWN